MAAQGRPEGRAHRMGQCSGALDDKRNKWRRTKRCHSEAAAEESGRKTDVVASI